MSLNPLIAVGVLLSTATTDAVYVLFNAAVSERRRIRAASWSSVWYLLSAFAVISYTQNATYVIFCGDRFVDRRLLRGNLAEAYSWRFTFVDARAHGGCRQVATSVRQICLSEMPAWK